MSLNTILATTPLTSTGYHLKATGTTIGNSLIWDNGTNVGIGNTNTSYTLDVSGTGRFTGATILASSSGNVGIGVTPSSWSTANSVKALQNYAGSFWNYNDANIYVGLNYYWDGSNRRYISSVPASEYQQNGDHIFFTAPTGTAGNVVTLTERMRITSGGNVGIGVIPNTYPNFYNVKALQIGSAGAIFNLDVTSSNTRLYLSNNAYIESTAAAQTYIVTGAASQLSQENGAFFFRQAPSGTANTAITFTTPMTITSGGNVGINNTTPSTYLDVSNNGTNNNAYITTRNTGINGYRSGAIFTNSAAGGLSWYLVSTNNGDGDWGGGKFAISTNNAVGVYLNGSTATTWTGQSDIRLKDIDSEIENAIDKVNKLRGVRFTWKSDETKKMQVGLIAQEVKEVLPEAVDFDETNEDYRMGVQYTDLIPLLVNAIKEQQIQIQNLQEQINILAK